MYISNSSRKPTSSLFKTKKIEGYFEVMINGPLEKTSIRLANFYG